MDQCARVLDVKADSYQDHMVERENSFPQIVFWYLQVHPHSHNKLI